MMTNLKTVSDHPAHVVQNMNTTGPRPGVWSSHLSILGLVAADLRQYEADHDVTFAALDNETLAELRKAYNGGQIEELEGFIGLVEDLLGLADA